jgi:hypothetical protein
MDFEIPLWLIITFGVCAVTWPLILMVGITAPWGEILIPRYEWKNEEPEYGWVFGGYVM